MFIVWINISLRNPYVYCVDKYFFKNVTFSVPSIWHVLDVSRYILHIVALYRGTHRIVTCLAIPSPTTILTKFCHNQILTNCMMYVTCPHLNKPFSMNLIKIGPVEAKI